MPPFPTGIKDSYQGVREMVEEPHLWHLGKRSHSLLCYVLGSRNGRAAERRRRISSARGMHLNAPLGDSRDILTRRIRIVGGQRSVGSTWGPPN
jgi:hypothetical protein